MNHDNKRLEKGIQTAQGKTYQVEEIHKTQRAKRKTDGTGTQKVHKVRKIRRAHLEIQTGIMQVLFQRDCNKHRIQKI